MPTDFVFGRRPVAYPDESILGYLKRLAALYELNAVTDLDEEAGLPHPLKETTVMHDPRKLAASLSDQWSVLEPAYFRPVGSKYEYRGNVLPLEYLHLGTMRVCGECIREKPYHRHLWHFAPIDTCHIHETSLFDRCPNCSAELTWESTEIANCPSCRAPIVGTEQTKQPVASLLAARCIQHIGGIVPSSDPKIVPPILSKLGLADVVAFLEYLGRLATSDHSKAKSTFTLPQLVAAGYSMAVGWPGSFHKALAVWEDLNKHRGSTPYQRLDPFYIEGATAHFASWGGRVQSALIHYVADRPGIEVDIRHALHEQIFKMRSYCPEEEVLATLRANKGQLRLLRASSNWSVDTHRAEGKDWFKFGDVIKLREHLDQDIFGYHSRPYHHRPDYPMRTPAQLKLEGWENSMRRRKRVDR